ncbi:hypothetical protein [Methylococcus sp. EFPC2]|uniref:hypothetical protein n=1 Tax=Methylococcus sp. EFPC2 TaxID=2812648 RepID=UPI0019675878|nr:hypothetical protein [Methylococcus sp. EFPC2]QSA98412.1 hypothetical protein JWZ97_06280 [Methylococcus sp. EFPC2]
MVTVSLLREHGKFALGSLKKKVSDRVVLAAIGEEEKRRKEMAPTAFCVIFDVDESGKSPSALRVPRSPGSLGKTQLGDTTMVPKGPGTIVEDPAQDFDSAVCRSPRGPINADLVNAAFGEVALKMPPEAWRIVSDLVVRVGGISHWPRCIAKPRMIR